MEQNFEKFWKFFKKYFIFFLGKNHQEWLPRIFNNPLNVIITQQNPFRNREKSHFFHFEMAGRIKKLASNSLKIATQLHYDLFFKNGGQPKKSIDNFRFHCNIYDSTSKTENFVILKTKKRVNFFEFIFQP